MKKIYLQQDLTKIDGYNANATQVLEHDENGLVWANKQA